MRWLLVDPLGLCGNWFTDVISAQCSVSSSNPGMFGNGGNGSWQYNCVIIPGNDSHPQTRTCGLIWIPGRDRFDLQRLGPGGSPGGNSSPANNGPVVLKNPCQVQGRALPPSAYAASGQAAKNSTTDFALDVAMGWPRGDYLDPQPLASGTKYQNQAYGNYVFGVYMQAAGFSLPQTLSGANAYAAYSKLFHWKQYSGNQMDPNYSFLPAASVANIANGYYA